jgi:membrane protease YdiL (CAAX protease family)
MAERAGEVTTSHVRAVLRTKPMLAAMAVVSVGVCYAETTWMPWRPIYYATMALLAVIVLLAGPVRWDSFREAWQRYGGWMLLLTIAMLLLSFGRATLEKVIPGQDLDESIKQLAVGWHQRTGGSLAYFRGFYAFIVLMFNPLFEEMFYRWYLFGRWRAAGGGVAAAMLLSAASFALRHDMHLLTVQPYPWTAAALWFVSLFIMGLVVAWFYERTGNLWTVVMPHFLHNVLWLTFYRTG